MVSTSAIIGIVLELILVVLGPIVLLLIWRGKTKTNLMPALAGAIIFIVFALVLEGIPKVLLFGGTNDVSLYILNHAWAYTFFGCLLAGVFEEVGRYVAFRFFLKKHVRKETGITYGIGHGGIEAIIITGLSAFSILTLALTINTVGIDSLLSTVPAEQLEAATASITAVTSLTFFSTMLGVLERVFAITLHIALSVVVFSAVREPGKWYFLPLAIVLHMVFDVPAALYQFGVLNLVVTEILIGLEAVLIAVFAYKLYQKQNG